MDHKAWAADVRNVPDDNIYRSFLVGTTTADMRDVSYRRAVSTVYYVSFTTSTAKQST